MLYKDYHAVSSVQREGGVQTMGVIRHEWPEPLKVKVFNFGLTAIWWHVFWLCLCSFRNRDPLTRRHPAPIQMGICQQIRYVVDDWFTGEFLNKCALKRWSAHTHTHTGCILFLVGLVLYVLILVLSSGSCFHKATSCMHVWRPYIRIAWPNHIPKSKV